MSAYLLAAAVLLRSSIARREKTGSRRIQVLVDSNNLIPESDENDNDALASLQVNAPPLPNLAILESGIGFNPLYPTDGDKVLVTVTVQNNGDADAENIAIQILDVSGGDTSPIGGAQIIDSIAAGGVGTVEVEYDVAEKAGIRLLRVLVDPSNHITESDETDNRATASLVVESQRPRQIWSCRAVILVLTHNRLWTARRNIDADSAQ